MSIPILGNNYFTQIQNIASTGVQTLLVDDLQATNTTTSGLSLGLGNVVTSSTHTLELSQTITIFDTTSNAIAVTVPNGNSPGQVIILINSVLSGNNITLAGSFLDSGSVSTIGVSTTVSFFWSGSQWMPLSYWQWD